MSDPNPAQLVGTWELSVSYLKSGEAVQCSADVPRVTYTFLADGSGIMLPGTIAAAAMQWKVGEGRLRLATAIPKSQSTHEYEMPDADTLTLCDRHGGRHVFKRRANDGTADPREI